MLNRTDTTMLSALIVVTLSSGWAHYQRNIEAPPEVAVKELVNGEIQAADVVEAAGELIQVPDFSQYQDVTQKKNAFFDFMRPLIELENERILLIREKVLMLSGKRSLSDSEQEYLNDTARLYRMEDADVFDVVFFEELLAKVDIIPPSLALVQSANESAWGTSRFALQGNNFYGQWCFSKGCGLVPSGRPQGQTYEVRRFENVADSIRSYMHNLNTHFSYEGMRELRVNRRLDDEPVTGPILAQGLYAYSIRGLDYVDELISMIASNDLLRYDLGKDEKPES